MEDIFSDVSSLDNSSLPNLNNDPLALKLAKRSSENGSIAEGTFLADAGNTSKVQRISGKVQINQTLEEMFPRVKRDKRLWARGLQNSKKSDQSDTSDFSFRVDEKNNVLKSIKPKNDFTVNLTFSDSENDTFSTNENILRKLPLKNKYSVKIDLSDTESSLEESIHTKNPFRKPFNPKIDLSLDITKDLSRISDKIDISNKENELDSIKNDFSSDECINVNTTQDLTMDVDEPRKSATFNVSNLSQNATYTISKSNKVSKNETSHNLTNENDSTFISSNDTFTINSTENMENGEDLSIYDKERQKKNNQENVNSTQDKSLIKTGNIVEKVTERVSKRNVDKSVSKNEETPNKTGKNMSIASCSELLHKQGNELNYTQNISGNEAFEKTIGKTANMSKEQTKDVSGNEKTPNKREKRKQNKSKIDVCPESIQGDENELNCTYDIPENQEKLEETNKKEKNNSNIDGCPESSRRFQGEENGLNNTQNITGNEKKLDKSCIKKGKQKEKNKLNKSSNIPGCPESSGNIQEEENELNCNQNIAGNEEKLNKSCMKKGKQAETPSIKNKSSNSSASNSNIQGEENGLNCTQNIAGNEEKLNKSCIKKGKQAETQNKSSNSPESSSNIQAETQNKSSNSPASSSNIQGEENGLNCTQNIGNEKLNKSFMKKGKQAKTPNIKNKSSNSPASNSNIQGEENGLNCTQNISGNEEKLNKSCMKKGKQAETQNKSSNSPASSSNFQGEEIGLNCTQNIGNEKLNKSCMEKGKQAETPNIKNKSSNNPTSSSNIQGEENGLNCTQNIAGNDEKGKIENKKRKLEETPNKNEKHKRNSGDRCLELSQVEIIAGHEETLDKSVPELKKAKNKLNKSNIGCSESSGHIQEENGLNCSQNIGNEKLNKSCNLTGHTELNQDDREEMELDFSHGMARNDEKQDKSISKNESTKKQNLAISLAGRSQKSHDQDTHGQNISGNREKLDKSRINKAKDDSKTGSEEKRESRLKKTEETQNRENNEQNKTENFETTRNKKGKENKTSNISKNYENLEKSIITRSKLKQTPNSRENLTNVSNKKLKKTKDRSNNTSKNTISDNELSDNNLVRNIAHPKNSLYLKDTPCEDVFPLTEYIENKQLKRPTIADIDSPPKQEFTKPLEKSKRITRSASKNKGKSINDSSYETDIDISSIHEYNPRKKLLIYHSTPINKVPINSNTTDESLSKESNKFTLSQNLLSQSMSGIQDLPIFEPIKDKTVSVNKTNTLSLINNATMEISNTPSTQINETMEASKSKSLIETTRKTRSSSKTLTQFTTDISSSDTSDTDFMDTSSETDTNTIEETKIRKFNKPQKRDSVFGVETSKTKKPKNNQLALPKLYKPAKWINKKFYDYLQLKLKHIHKLKTRKVSEEFAILLYHTYTLVMHGHDEAIDALKLKSKEIGLCENNMDFFMLIHEYTPFQFRRLVIPLGGAYGTKCSSVKIDLYEKL